MGRLGSLRARASCVHDSALHARSKRTRPRAAHNPRAVDFDFGSMTLGKNQVAAYGRATKDRTKLGALAVLDAAAVGFRLGHTHGLTVRQLAHRLVHIVDQLATRRRFTLGVR